MAKSTPEQDNRVPQAFLELMNSQDEFPLSVEGAKTASYASTVINVDQEAGRVLLKLIRPMPAQLPIKTPCKVSIGALGDHWRAMLTFQGRAGHLQYMFGLPKYLEKAGRREHKRYKFRPRENVNVYVQDSGLPGIGAVGQLLDLSYGGLAFKPERAFRVEDGARLALGTSIFERGKAFPIIRIDGLQELRRPLRLRGSSVFARERNSVITAAFVFGILDPIEEERLERVLEARERRSTQGAATGAEAPPHDQTASE